MRERPDLGTVGLWTGLLQRMPMARIRELAHEIDALGYHALWLPESPGGRDVLSFSAIVLAATPRIPVATGIAIIWVRDSTAAASGARTIDEAFPGRFVLGLGVSHGDTGVRRGFDYVRPLSAMRRYLQEMAEAPYDGPPHRLPPVVLAALGPRMLELSREGADGAHPFLAPVAHTALAREILGGGPLLCPELGVIATSDPELARETGRSVMERFLAWPNYRRHMRRIGYSEQDLEGGGVDRLIDDVFAWGGEGEIRGRVDEHLEAGADHVAVQVIPVNGRDWFEEVRRLAPALLE